MTRLRLTSALRRRWRKKARERYTEGFGIGHAAGVQHVSDGLLRVTLPGAQLIPGFRGDIVTIPLFPARHGGLDLSALADRNGMVRVARFRRVEQAWKGDGTVIRWHTWEPLP